MTKQERFESLQARWRKAQEAVSELSYNLRSRYGNTWSAPAALRNKYERAQKREHAASDAIFTWLDNNSPRQWRIGVPAHWVCDSLTYADAITADALSVIPPPCYGSYPGDSQRFAQPVSVPAAV